MTESILLYFLTFLAGYFCAAWTKSLSILKHVGKKILKISILT